jgi:sugar phosphate isomerase/epimerase
MRLGGSVQKPYSNPEEWLNLVRELGYSAVIAPVTAGADAGEVRAYGEIARDNDLIIGEVGVWKNVLAPGDKERGAAMAYAAAQLQLADELDAKCCVNIAGARGAVWDGYYPDNYSEDVYAMIVDSVRGIIDAVKPKRAFYTLEPMPWMRPDSPEGYLQLIKDIGRAMFGAHLDYANMINGVERYHNCSAFIRRCFELLGPHIKSVHAKDVVMDTGLPCRIRETPPGRGTVDFKMVLKLTQALGDDATLFIEHLDTHEDYMAAAGFMRSEAAAAGVAVKNVFK